MDRESVGNESFTWKEDNAYSNLVIKVVILTSASIANALSRETRKVKPLSLFEIIYFLM